MHNFPAPAITGTGLVSALGSSVEQTWESLLAGRFIRGHSRAAGIEGDDRVLELAVRAGREAMDKAGWSPFFPSPGTPGEGRGGGEMANGPATALILATSKGPIETWLNALPKHMAILPYVAAGGFGCFGLGQTGSQVAGRLGFGAGPRLTVAAACASGLHGLVRAAMMLGGGEVRRALVIAVEVSLHPLFLASFERLGVLAPPGHGCRPFDRQRKGFVVSEAAAAVCLESNGPAGRPRVERFALGSDATHLTGTDCSGQTLRHMLRTVIASRRIDLIHAHGTGTALNDEIELAALEAEIAEGGPVPVYSHKAALGHSLGAAGLVSIVLNCKAHQEGLVPGNVLTADPMPSRRLLIERHGQGRRIERSVAIAAGFGGAMAVVSIESA